MMCHKVPVAFFVAIASLLFLQGECFKIEQLRRTISRIRIGPLSPLKAAAVSLSAESLSLDMARPVSPGPHIRIKGKILNPWGLFTAISAFSAALFVLPVMIVLAWISDLRGHSKQRKVLDWMIHYWAQFAMTLTLCRPKLIGKENLPGPNEAVMYVPNHTSFMDILVLSGFVPRPFKYLSKSEIMDIPLVGTAMKLAKHVFLKRDDLRSTLECTDITVERLEDGNSMVLFAEGTRSKDGVIQNFKKGAFQMAKAAGVKIIPVSIGNLHRWMPPSALLPLAPLRQVYIKIHPAIDSSSMPVTKLRAACFEAVNSGLPPYQQFGAVISSASIAAAVAADSSSLTLTNPTTTTSASDIDTTHTITTTETTSTVTAAAAAPAIATTDNQSAASIPSLASTSAPASDNAIA